MVLRCWVVLCVFEQMEQMRKCWFLVFWLVYNCSNVSFLGEGLLFVKIVGVMVNVLCDLGWIIVFGWKQQFGQVSSMLSMILSRVLLCMVKVLCNFVISLNFSELQVVVCVLFIVMLVKIFLQGGRIFCLMLCSFRKIVIGSMQCMMFLGLKLGVLDVWCVMCCFLVVWCDLLIVFLNIFFSMLCFCMKVIVVVFMLLFVDGWKLFLIMVVGLRCYSRWNRLLVQFFISVFVSSSVLWYWLVSMFMVWFWVDFWFLYLCFLLMMSNLKYLCGRYCLMNLVGWQLFFLKLNLKLVRVCFMCVVCWLLKIRFFFLFMRQRNLQMLLFSMELRRFLLNVVSR